MFRKSFVFYLLGASFVLIFSAAAFGQLAPVGGTVEMEKDGVRTPVAGALVEAYRMDMKTTMPSTKTDKKGKFGWAGMPLGDFTLSVSAPGAAPSILSNVKAGQEKIIIIMGPGDGSKYTEAEVRAGAKPKGEAPGAPQLTAEEKKAAEDFEKEKAAIEAKNANVMKSNEVIAASLKAGNDASAAKNYDLAIAKYTEGIDAAPDYIGSAPVLLNNRGLAYDNRAVETYNAARKSTDPAAKVEGYNKTKADLASSLSSYAKAWEILQKATPADIQNPQNHEANKSATIRQAKDALKHAVLTEQVDPTLIDAAKVLLPEYPKFETDATKKADADLIMADLYRVTADSDNAIPAYKKILETSPENLDALSGVGFSLVNNGYIKNDKAQLQEGANYLQKFIGIAPDTNKFKLDAVGLIETLKKEQNVAPQKVPKKKP